MWSLHVLIYPAWIGAGFTAAGPAVHLVLLTAKQMALPLKMGFVSLILLGSGLGEKKKKISCFS